MDIPLIDLQAQYATLRPEIDDVVAGVLSSCHFINGPEVKKFETAFAAVGGHENVVGCANGTDALELLLDAWEIGAGDEVIVPAMSWISTSEIIVTRGATPVFVDIDPENYCMDTDLIEQAISPATRAIIVVHLYGYPAELKRLREIADRHKLYLLEDCAQAHGANSSGQPVGTLGDGATYSFFPSKSLGAYGDAGAVCMPDPDLCTRVRALANHGMPGKRHHHVYHGRNSRLDALQAAVLNVKVKHLTDWIAAKNRIADTYIDRLANLENKGLALPKTKAGDYHGYHLFVVRTERRDELADYLEGKGISTTVHYPTALPLHACYADYGFRAEDYPVAVTLSRTALSIPMFAELTEEQVNYIIDNLQAFYAA